MAIVKPDGSLSGVVGNGVLRSYDGVTVLSAKPDEVRNPRTHSQQTNRLKLRNIINIYGAMKAALKDNFQGKSGKQSDYSRFQGCNLPQPGVYLTFKECDGSVVAPYMVSYGTLPMIGYHIEGEWLVTDIIGGVDLTMDSGLMMLSEDLLWNEGLFKAGDSVEFIACYQDVTNDFPTVKCEYCEFKISRGDRTPIRQILNGFEVRINEYNQLCIRREGACGLAIVRRRGEGRGAFASVQFLAVNNPVLAGYMSEEHKEMAIASYARKK